MIEDAPDRASTGSRQWLSLIAMTLAASMVLIDQTAVPLASPDVVIGLGGSISDGQWILTANILPLAAFLVLGGRIADVVGLKRAFLAGAAVFLVATAMAGAAQAMSWMIGARVLQGLAAAVMVPTSVAITSQVWPKERRGYALGLLAGGSAFFAALGPVVGGILTAIDWRLVFLINVPIAAIAFALAWISTPDLQAERRPLSSIDWWGAAFLAVAMLGLVYGLAEGQPSGWTAPHVLGALTAFVVFGALFIVAERRAAAPLIRSALFRRLNFTAATISQVLAGMLELGLGYLLPFYLLLVVGVGPVTAGLALIPGSIPIILAGPLAGRLFDRVGGRGPLVGGFVVLALSGLALGLGAGGETALAVIPGLVLQGIGLGIVLTVNDPVGMNAVDEDEQGAAAGILNTAEQVGGAIGIAVLVALQLGYYFDELDRRLSAEGLNPTPDQVSTVHDYIARAEQQGLRNVERNPIVDKVYPDLVESHAHSFQFAFTLTSGLAVIGAVACFLLVRRTPVHLSGPIFSRRSRWMLAHTSSTEAASDEDADPERDSRT